ncbi:DUF3772 domain-containing protein [Stagnihabitans tardus]|uniref:DUF3772 domain-containing protein n=1 Tax=Stagnihabitans tardus TaxID=2699202 RepID=A0AAE4YC61_9RHOB|nr:DUF3772 domain-containing protein [Stagnihabitans tardus]NBZ88952.1 DUF3772 domain-containing protein [Stagnihabitans tardus]
MSQAGRIAGLVLGAGGASLRRAVMGALALATALALPLPALSQASGGAAPGQAPLTVQADSSGAIIPMKPDAPAEAPQSGGFAPQGGAKPAATQSGGGAPTAKPVASGGASGGALDYQGWERMAVRAESALTNQSLSNQGLENLRTELTRWREQLSGAQSANSTRIATLKDQIDALGPPPEGDAAEEPEIATRRAELTAQMGRLQAPGIAAEEAYRRADGLIREIDRLLRERQASELLKLWPNPLYPPNWTDAAKALSDTALALWDETARRVTDGVAQKRLVDNLPLILPLLLFALAGLWRGGPITRRLLSYLPGPSSARGRRIWETLASLGPVLVPVLACLALAEALRLTTMLGPIGGHIADVLGQTGFAIMAAAWLGGRVFPADEGPTLLPLPPERRAEGRFLTSLFGVLIAVAMLRRAAMAEIDVTDAATSVLNLPIILAGAVVLVRLGQLLNRADPGSDEGRAVYRTRLVRLLARGVILFGAIAPLLAAAGYISAASALVFPSAMTLALAALLYLAQGLVGDIYALATRGEDQDALVPVLISFGLALATLPLVALIWGARVADLTELWTRFQEGFRLGETQISPTDFLFFAVLFAIGLTLTRLLQGALKNTVLPRTSLDQGGQNAIVSGLGYAGILVSALVAINATGIDLSGLAIVAGALSVGIGFGLQTIVSNFVSGIILLIERPVSEGDWIEVGSVQGVVKAISVRSTRIQTFDRSDVIVPNSDLITRQVTNWTRFSLTGRLIVPVSVPLTEDSRRVSKLLREIAEAQPLVLLSPPPAVVLTGFAGDALNFEIRVILRDVNFQHEVRTEINHQVAARFAAERVAFSAAHRDYLAKKADDAAAEAEKKAEEAAHIAAVEAILGAPLPKAKP